MQGWEELGLFVRRKTQGGSQAVQAASPVKQSLCSECGQAFAEDDMIRFAEAWVCASCKPLFVQKIKEGVTLAGEMEYAGFWGLLIILSWQSPVPLFMSHLRLWAFLLLMSPLHLPLSN
jgi:hypothetical protein